MGNKKVKQIKNRENRIIRDLDHKISKKIVEIAAENNCGIKLLNKESHSNTPCTTGYSINCSSFWNTKPGCSE